jgi:hypothetical protein
MSNGFISPSGALDAIFAPGDSGFDAGFVDAGTNLGNKYAPLSSGSQAAGTGFVRVNTDLNAYFAAAGTVAPSGLWPVGGGFVIGNNGGEQFATDTITILCGRLTWQYQNLNGSPSDTAYGSNLIANRFVLCPGTGSANANSWFDEGGFVRSGIYGLPASAVLRFEVFTDNLPGSAFMDVTCGAQTEWAPGWQIVHTGGCALCSNTPPYFEDPMNIFDFSPGPGLYYGMHAPYLYWANPNNWAIRLGAMFAISKNSGTLNVIRVRVRRIA